MRLRLQIGVLAAACSVLAVAAWSQAQAQVRNSGASTITLQAVLTDSLTVSLSGQCSELHFDSG